MTAIAGLIYDGEIYMGGDSAGVGGLDIMVRKDTKVFKVDNFIIGYTSSFRMGQLLRFSFKPPLYDQSMDVYEYMCTLFIEELRKCLKDGGYSKIDNNVEEGGNFLVGHKGRLFEIFSDYQVAENECDYAACGCGASYALGSFFVSNKLKNMSPGMRVYLALEAAETFSAGVRRPFNIKILRGE
jgi:ATP-dependent protease HslVU (ClpYQ) peptidase subunit